MLKKILILIFLLSLSIAAQNKKELKTEKQKFSYSIGYELGKNMHDQKLKLDLEALITGLKNGLDANPTLMSEKEMTDLIVRIQSEMIQKREMNNKKIAEENLEKANKFLAQNSNKENVNVTESGLQYEILEEGTGKSPTTDNEVRVHYKGNLLDGTVFDSSYKRGKPHVFTMQGIIKGWVEALTSMKVGSKWRVFIPPNLAYGERGSGNIDPNELLIFEIELLEIIEK